MGLQIWLPLNEDLRQQGLLNLTASTNIQTPTFVDEGKLGKALHFDESDGTVVFEANKDIFQNELSVSFWINPLSNSDIILNLFATIFLKIAEDGGEFSFEGLSEVCNFPLEKNKWQNICLTKKNNIINIYVDGTLVVDNYSVNIYFDTDLSVIGGALDVSGGNFNINGFRIYDEIISQKEINDICKALLIHYKLDKVPTNKIEFDYSGNNLHGTQNNNFTLYNYGKYGHSISANGSGWIVLPQTYLESKYTISIWVRPQSVDSWDCCWHLGGLKDVNRVQFYYSSNTRIIIRCMNNGTLEYSHNDNSGKIKSTTMNHVVVRYDGDVFGYFINGVKINEKKISYVLPPHVRDVSYLYAEDNKNGCRTQQATDFRIYSSALTDNEILDLYNNSMKIDSNGNVYGYVYNEEDADLFKLNKNSNINIPNLIESDKTSLSVDTLYSNKFYEI